MADKKKRVIKIREPVSGTEFDVSVDDLKDPEVMAAILGKGKEYEEVEGAAPKQPQFAEGEGPQDVEKNKGEVRLEIGRPQFVSQGQVDDETSDAPFTLENPEITVMAPNGDVYTMSKASWEAKKDRLLDSGFLSAAKNVKSEIRTPQEETRARRSAVAQNRFGKPFSELSEKDQTAVLGITKDSSLSDLKLPTLGQAGKAIGMSLLGPMGAAAGVTSLADAIVPDAPAAEAMQTFAKRAAALPGQALSAVGEFIAPNTAARMAAEQPKAPVPAPPGAQPPPIPTDIPTVEPGQVPGAPATAQAPQPQEEFLDTSEMQMEANARKSATAQLLEEDKAKGAIEQNKIKLQEVERLQARKEKMDEAINRARRAYENTIEAINDPSMRVDPDHFWASRNTGQKIAAAVGVLLGGLGKGPNEAIGIIDRAIAKDLQVQQQNIGHRRAGLDTKARGQLQIMDHLRQQGMDDYAQIKLSSAIAYDNVSRQLKALEAQAGSQQAAADLALLDAAVIDKREKNIREAKEGIARRANIESQTEENYAQAAAARAKASQEKKAPPQALKAMTEVQYLEDGLRTIMEQEKAFKATTTGILPQQANAITEKVDFTGKSATAKYEARRMESAYKVHRSLEPGARTATDNDLKVTAERILPTAADPTGEYKFAGLKRDAIRKLLTYMKEAKNLGYDTSEAEARIVPIIKQAMGQE